MPNAVLAGILRAPEVRRIYVGSFWQEPLTRGNFMNDLFEREAVALLQDLASAPRNNTTSKLNDVIMRARRVRVHALVLAELRSSMPKMTGKDRKQKELIAGLDDVFFKVCGFLVCACVLVCLCVCHWRYSTRERETQSLSLSLLMPGHSPHSTLFAL